MQNHLSKHLPRGNDPTLILYDGHTSHISPELIQWAKDHNIILFGLPAHASHLVQPLDVGCFGSFKSSFYTQCQNYHPLQHLRTSMSGLRQVHDPQQHHIILPQNRDLPLEHRYHSGPKTTAKPSYQPHTRCHN